MRWLGWLLAVMMSASGACAAPSITVKVSAKGSLEFTPQNIRTLGVKQKRGELVCVQFPMPPVKDVKPTSRGPVHEISHAVHEPRIYGGLRNDGGLTVVRTRVLTSTGQVPGKPGTTYRASVKKGAIVLAQVG
jgi:hypothetical protein